MSMQVGDELPALVKEPVSKLQLVKYAGASGDFNLIHTDVETAKAVGLPGVIAHGMLSMGFLGQLVNGVAGPEQVRRLQVRFNAMVRLGDQLTCHGIVKAIAGGRATLEVWAENQRGERITSGEAEVEIGDP